MKDRYKTKAQLIIELDEARRRLAGIDAAASEGKVSNLESTTTVEKDGKKFSRSIRPIGELDRVLKHGAAVLYSLKVEGERFSLQWISESLTKLTGYTVSEARLETWWLDHIHPGDRDRVLACIPPLFIDDRVTVEYRFQHKHGGYVFVHDELRLLRDPAGAPMEAIGTWVDVTERRAVEQALRSSDERLRDTFNLAPVGMSLASRAGRVLKVNRAFCEMVGYSEEEVLRTDFFAITHPDDLDLNRKLIRQLWEGEIESLNLEKRFFHKDGYIVWANVSSTVAKDPEGRPMFLAAQIHDITEKKKSEERIHFQASLLDQVRNAVIAVDLDLNITLWNNFAEVLYQWKKEEALGKNVIDLVVPGGARKNAEEIVESLKSEGSWDGEFALRKKDGSTFLAYLHNSVIRGTNNEIVGFVGVSTDISERLRLDRALEESQNRFRLFMDHLPGYAWIKDSAGRYVYVNKGIKGILPAHEDDWFGRTDDEFWPDLAHEYQINDRQVLESGRELQTVEPWVLDGKLRYVLVMKFPLQGETEDEKFVAGTSIDITERKHMEDELRNQKDFLQKIIDHIPVMIRFRGADGRLKLVNQEWQRTLGWSFDELQERDLDLLAQAYPDPEYRQQVIDFMNAATGEWRDFRTIVRDGRVIDTCWASVFLPDGTSLGIGQDITQRKQADQLLRRQAAQLAALHEIELEISAASELSRVLDIVTRRAAQLLEASHCSTYILDPEHSQLNLVASLDSDLIGHRLEIGEGLAGRVAATGSAMTIPNYNEWEGRVAIFEEKAFGPSIGAPLKWQHQVIGTISISRVMGEEPFTEDDAHFLKQIAAEASIAIHQATLFEEVQRGHNRLKVLSHKLIDAQEAERKRLSRDLHDQVGQALTAVQLSLQTIDSALKDKLLDECLVSIDDALQQVHNLSLELRPSMLDDLGLVAALRWYVDRVAIRSGMTSCFDAAEIDGRVAPEVETACFRIAQEALTNVLRHARARTIWVHLKHYDSNLQLVVRDDGSGFDVREALSRSGPDTSLGLQGMQERAAAAGGVVTIKSQKMEGATIEARFPL